MNPTLRIIPALAVGLLTFGLAPIVVRWAGDSDPVLLAFSRLFLALLFLTPVWLKLGGRLSELIQGGVRIPLLIASGVALGLHLSFWILSLQLTSVASASVLVTMHPVLLILLERFFHKTHYNWKIWVSVLIALSGSMLLSVADSGNAQAGSYPNPSLGNLLAIVAAFLFSAYFMIGRTVRQKTSWINYVYYVYGTACLTTGALFLFLSFFNEGGTAAFTTPLLLAALFLAIGPTIVGHGSMNYAVKYVSPTLLSTLVLAEAILASVLAYFLYDERPSEFSIVAMCMVIAGIVLTWAWGMKQGEAPSSETESDKKEPA